MYELNMHALKSRVRSLHNNCTTDKSLKLGKIFEYYFISLILFYIFIILHLYLHILSLFLSLSRSLSLLSL